MSPELTQVLMSLFTIIASGVASSVVTYKLNSNKQERDVKRQKLEHLHLAVRKYCLLLGGRILDEQMGMSGKLTQQQVVDQTIKNGDDDTRSFDNINMLVSIYFPSLGDNLSRILECRTRFADAVIEFKRRGQIPDHDLFNVLTKVGNDLESEEKETYAAIQKIARRIH